MFKLHLSAKPGKMATKVIALCFVLLSTLSFAQKSKDHSSARFEYWLKKTDSAILNQQFVSSSYADSVLSIAEIDNDPKQLADTYMAKGRVANLLENMSDAQEYLLKAERLYVETSQNCKALLARAWIANTMVSVDNEGAVGIFKQLIQRQNECLELQTGVLELLISNPISSIHGHDSSIFYLKEALVKAEINDKAYTANILRKMGVYHTLAGNHTEGVEFLNRSAEVCLEENNDVGLARTYLWISRIQGSSGNDSLAIQYGESALDILGKDTTNLDLIIGAKVSLGNTYFSSGNLVAAKKYYNSAIDIFKKSGRNHSEVFISTLDELGLAHLNLNQFRSATLILSSCLRRSTGEGQEGTRKTLNFNLASAYARLNELDSAKKYAHNALSILKRIPQRGNELEQLYDMITYIYEHSGDLTKALFYSRRKFRVADSLYQVQQEEREKLTMLNENHQLALTTKQLEASNELLAKAQKDARFGKKLQTAYLIALLVCAVGVIALWFLSRKRKEITIKYYQEQISSLELQLSQQKRDLISYSLKSLTNHEMLEHVMVSLRELKDGLMMPSQKLGQILNELKLFVNQKDSWETFKYHFEQVNPDFFAALEQNFPDLTQNERRLTALMKMKFSNAEIAKLQNVQPDSIRKAKARLKSKLGIQSEDELIEMLNAEQVNK